MHLNLHSLLEAVFIAVVISLICSSSECFIKCYQSYIMHGSAEKKVQKYVSHIVLCVVCRTNSNTHLCTSVHHLKQGGQISVRGLHAACWRFYVICEVIMETNILSHETMRKETMLQRKWNHSSKWLCSPWWKILDLEFCEFNKN